MATIPDPKHVLDNRSTQLDPTQPAYYRSRGLSETAAEAAAAAERTKRASDAARLSGGGSSARKSG